MDLGLKDKIAFVTGASSGIGAATAHLFAAEGADVVVGYGQNQARAEQCAQVVRQHGRHAWLCSLEQSDPASVQQAIERLPGEVTGIDALVLCAGRNVITPLPELDTAEWQEIIDINLNGPFYVLKALLSRLRPGAGVVTVASVAAYTGAPHHAHYAAAKAGLINLTKSAARALAPAVRVNCVAPGITLTEMGQETVASLEPDYARTKLLLQRFAQPEEIARVIVFAASPAASFMTGATLDVNGGRDLR